MVSIAIGLLLLTAVVSVFVGSRTAYQSTSGLGALADGGRMALNFIGESARSAGFLACNSAQSATSGTLMAGNTIGDNFALATEGYEYAGTGSPGAFALPTTPAPAAGVGNWNGINGNLDAAIFAAGLPVPGSDVLVLRSSVQRVPAPQQAMAYTVADVAPGATTLSVTPVPAIAAGQYAVVSDCTKSVIFQATGVAAAQVTVGGSAGGLPVGFSAGALVSPLSTTIYYVGVSSDGASTSLWRLEQVNGTPFPPPAFTPEELVPDIENMQVLYGIDTSGTQTAGAFVTADQVGTFNVVSLQVAVLAASPPGGNPVQSLTHNLLGTIVTAPADTRMRHVFSATINLRNAVN
jgi:type IV pilus assembly protein PilW